MKNFLEWLSGFHGESHKQKRSKEWVGAMDKEVELYNLLEEQLNEEGKNLLERFSLEKDCVWTFEVMDYYKIGFKAGMQLAYELSELE